MKHYSVMLNEVIDNLNIHDDGIYIDATLGYAGHSSEILKRMKRGFLFAFDNDLEAILYSRKRLSEISNNFEIFHSNFSNMKEKLDGKLVDGIIFDLGFSSPQIDNPDRGFSFMNDGPLDMRMDTTKDFSAYNVINDYSLEDLTETFFSYGEEKTSRTIAKNIVEARKKSSIKTTNELVEIIKSAVGLKYFNLQHPERKIFQAIRIEVNNELGVLRSVLPDAINMLKPGGRICVITFHSLENRIVKNIFKEYSSVPLVFSGLPDIPEEYKPKIKLVNKKPITASEEELKENSRSKSAKLRVIERV
ncbi:MAG: 16S rRNA (cytosine(1402)-N(4))-methyltransferase RsmH [Bacilli bacterium]|nr:16S rRNA (cytosine(1402)-N(4))-methyltransferase RsmH [Bacilli bacterium]